MVNGQGKLQGWMWKKWHTGTFPLLFAYLVSRFFNMLYVRGQFKAEFT